MKICQIKSHSTKAILNSFYYYNSLELALNTHFSDLNESIFIITACRCDPDGSVSSQCDGSTGRCDCLPNVVGARCDQCLSGYWGPRKVFGCTKCDCCQQGIVESSPCNLVSCRNLKQTSYFDHRSFLSN